MNEPDIGEQAISTAAEVGMETQLDEAENLDVDIRTNPVDLAQGKLESVDFEGEGLVMEKDLRAEKLDIETDDIEIDPLKATFGNIEMEHPTNATARIVLTDDDIQRAFNSEYIQSKLKNREVNIDGKTMYATAKQVKFATPGEGKISIEAVVFLDEASETQPIAFTAMTRISDRGNKIIVENVVHASGKNEASELTQALLDSTEELLDLRNFELEEMSLQLNKLDVQQGKMIIDADATVKQLPQD